MSSELVQQLRTFSAGLSAVYPHVNVTTPLGAADRIEALEAEVETLRSGSFERITELAAALEAIRNLDLTDPNPTSTETREG